MHIWRNTPALDLITQGYKCIRSSHWPAGIYPWHSIWYLSGSAMRVEDVCQSSLRIPMHSCSKIVQRQSNSLRRASKPLPYCLLNRCYWLAGPRLPSLWNLEFQANQESVNIRKKNWPESIPLSSTIEVDTDCISLPTSWSSCSSTIFSMIVCNSSLYISSQMQPAMRCWSKANMKQQKMEQREATSHQKTILPNTIQLQPQAKLFLTIDCSHWSH